MVKKSFIAIFFLIAFLSVYVSAQAQKIELEKVNTSLEKLRLGMLNENASLLDSVSSESLEYVHSNGKVETKEQFMAALVHKDYDFTTLVFNDVHVKIIKNTAIVRHALVGDIEDKTGNKTKLLLNVMCIFIKDKTGWRLIARQGMKA